MPVYPDSDDNAISSRYEKLNITRSASHIITAIKAYRQRHPEHADLSDDEILELIADDLDQDV